MSALDASRILLVHPLGYHAEAAGRDIARMANLMPPLGLLSLAAFLEKRGLSCDVVDCFADPAASERRIVELLLTRRPAWLGVSVTTSSFLDGVRLARRAKEALPGLRAVFGGPHVSALREKVLTSFPEVDFVIAGEGEESLAELMETGGNPMPRGIVHRVGRDAVFTGYRDKGVDLDTLPFPAYEKLDGFPDRYRLPLFNYPKAPNTSCISSRGCPYACTYCDRSVFRRTFRYNSAEYLYEHLAYLKARFGIRHVNFYDDQFTFHRGRVEAFCDLLAKKPLGVTFNCAVRAEHVDPELCRRMKDAGCWMMSLGIETGDPALLARHRQNADLELLADTIRFIHQAGIRVKGLLMLGLPGETVASIAASRDYIFRLPIDDFNLAKFTPFPGSPIYEEIHKHGTFDEDWEKMDCMHFQFVPRGFTREELERHFRDFYKAHYTRPKVLWGYVAMLWKSPDSWKRFLADFPQFWKFAHDTGKRVR